MTVSETRMGRTRYTEFMTLPGRKLSTTAQYTHVATKTIRDTVSPFEMLSKLQDRTIERSLE